MKRKKTWKIFFRITFHDITIKYTVINVIKVIGERNITLVSSKSNRLSITNKSFGQGAMSRTKITYAPYAHYHNN